MIEILHRDAVYHGSGRGTKTAGARNCPGWAGSARKTIDSQVSSLGGVLPLYDGAQRTTRSGKPSPFMPVVVEINDVEAGKR